jgi:hypothetical protein
VSRLRIAHCARFATRIRRVFRCISHFFALRERLGAKFLSEKIARPSEKIAGIGTLSH